MSNTDLFEDKSQEWDGNPVIQQLSLKVSQSILSNTFLNHDMVIMDFGAGTGLIASAVSSHVQKILAVDISQSMLSQLASKEHLKDIVTPICADIMQNPLETKVDGVVSAMALHHVEDTQKCIDTLFHHIKSGGFLALADLDTESGAFHPPGIEGVFHHGFDRNALSAKLSKAGFINISFVTAHIVQREPEAPQYPIFLVTAQKE